ncbi:MAG: PAS domain S-box protein [Spirochaetes bacterium]|nr:PAS domain S-box protein [Spirochaetota bacterium]
MKHTDKLRNLENALAASSLITITDAQGIIIHANEKFCETSRYTQNELLGQEHRIINSGYHSKEFMHTLWQTISRGDIWRGEMCNQAKNGDFFWVDTTIVPFLDSLGKPYQYYAIRHDITERKNVEEKNRLIVGALSDLVFIIDRRGTILDFHAANVNRLAFQPEEFLGKTPEAIFSPELAEQMMQLIRRTVENQRTEILEYSLSGKYYEAHSTPLEKNRLIVIVRDVTQAYLMNERLREQAELLDHARDAIHVRSLDHRILYWNDSSTRLYGYSAEEAVGQATRTLLYADSTIFDRAFAELLEKGEFIGDIEQIRKDRRKILVQAHWTLVTSQDKKSRSVLCVNSDITEKRQLEEQLLRAQRLESIGALAGGIAHDLNNILTPILLAMEVFQMGTLTTEQQELVKTIKMSARRGSDIIKQVLSFARGVESHAVPIDVRNLLSDIERIVRETFPKKIRIRVNVPHDVWQIRGDETLLHQVLMNLVVNARDAMPDGGQLLIEAENQPLDAQYVGMLPDISPGNFVILRVEDSGIGMAPSVIEKIFEPFFTTKGVTEGTGLGLSTSIRIVKAHGGIIRIYSEPKKGSRFDVYLPSWKSEEKNAIDQILMTAPRGNGENILVIDDEASIRNVTQQTLEAYGYRVVTAPDGAEAVALYAAQQDTIHLILTDMMMPVLDGLATIQVIRKMNATIPIIAVSGLEANGRLARLSLFDVKFFLPKPYSAETLLQTVHQALQEYKKLN